MSMRQKVHVDEVQILRAIVDETDLPPNVREHLADCETCGALKARIEEDLANLGATARRLVPESRRRISVPYETRRFLPSWLNLLRPVTAGLATAVVLSVVLVFVFFRTTPENKTAKLYREMIEDEKLISEVTSLEDDALPPYYLEMFPDMKPEQGERSERMVAPGFGSGISSLDKDGKKTS